MEISGSTLYVPESFTGFHDIVRRSEEEKARNIASFIQGHGFVGNEMLMDPKTGIVASAVDFAVEILTSYEDSSPPCEEIGAQVEFAYYLHERAKSQFMTLVRVEMGQNGVWGEID